MRLPLILTALPLVLLTACSSLQKPTAGTAKPSEMNNPTNSLQAFQARAAKYNSIVSIPPFETTTNEIADTVLKTISDGNASLDQIGALKPGEVNFTNTIRALDDMGFYAGLAENRLDLIKETSTNADVRAAATDAIKQLDDWSVGLEYREDVYNAVKAYAATNPQLEGEDKKLYDETLRDFRRAGLDLPKDQRDEVESLRKELSNNETDFESNITKAEGPIKFTKAQLDGVPDDFLAQIKTGDDEYTVMANITWHYITVMDNCKVEATRKQLYIVQNNLAAADNVPLLQKILVLRDTIAHKLGYASWADYQTEVKMAKNAATVEKFLVDLEKGLQPKFETEMGEFRQLKWKEIVDTNVPASITEIAPNTNNVSSKLPASAAPLIADAQQFFNAKKFADAEQKYEEVLKLDDQNVYTLGNLAVVEIQLNQLGQAEEHLDQALALAPNDTFCLSTLGNLKFRQGKLDESLNLLKRVTELNPGDAEVKGFLAAATQLAPQYINSNSVAINVWDWRYYANELRKQKYNVDAEQLRVYFPYQHVLEGMFAIYQHIFGLKFERVDAPYKWIGDLQLYSVSDAATGEPMGLFYLDMFPREGKFHHFAQFGIIDGKLLPDGKYQRPTVALICNFPAPANGKPPLMSHDDVVTLFHEFGHGMHSILTRAKYSRFSGTSVPGDFVEAPSQMLEHWPWDKRVLDSFAADYRDPSKKIPAEVLNQLRAAKYATEATRYRRQLSFALLDMALHTQIHAGNETNTVPLSNQILSDVFLPVPTNTAFVAYFGHLVGYDAGYYGYAWADAIADDMATVFKNAPDGFFDQTAGMRLRHEIYQVGDSRDINISIEKFLGRPRSIEPFLEEIGVNPVPPGQK